MQEYKYTYQDWLDGRLEQPNVYILYLEQLMSNNDYQKIALEQSTAYTKVLHNAFETLKREFKDDYKSSLLKSKYIDIKLSYWSDKINGLEQENNVIAMIATTSEYDGRYSLTKQQVDMYNASEIGDSHLISIGLGFTLRHNLVPDLLQYLIAANFHEWLLWYKEQQNYANTEPVLYFSESDSVASSLRDAEKAARQAKEQVSYTWLSNPDTELPELYQRLIKAKLIHPYTTKEQFEAVFTAQHLNRIEPISWIPAKALLAYFVDSIFSSGKIPIGTNHWSIAEKCFTKSKDLAQSRNNYLANKNGKHSQKPKGYHLVDEALKGL